MTTYISILRGINISGHRIIKMHELRQLCHDLGFGSIQTYIQSGNIVFQSKNADCRRLEHQLAKAITGKFAFDVPVLVKTLDEFSQIVENNPFIDEKGMDKEHFHVTFLSDLPNMENLNKIMEGHYQEDQFRAIGNVIYLYCPNKYSNTKLTNGFFESKLKVAATTRNWRTTNELLTIALETQNQNPRKK